MNSFDPQYLVYVGLALIPALIWMSFIFKKSSSTKFQVLVFLLGTFSVIPIALIQWLFEVHPEWNFIAVLDKQITEPSLHFLLIYSWVSITEELVKQWIVRHLDNKYMIIQTINDSIQYSLIAALSFSFIENIFYLYQNAHSLSLGGLMTMYLYRSTFCTCAHLVFSGFFGLYFGIAKFSISIVEQANLSGKKLYFSNFIGKLLNISKIQAYQESTILKGLLIAIAMHTFFNYNLEMNVLTGQPLYILVSALFTILGFLMLRRILKNRAGHLILVEGINEEKSSSMANTDEEVVIELLGMWFNKGKYVDVIHICERLLRRDPDNKIVQLFKAKAVDQMSVNSPYKQILNKLFPNK